MIYEDKFIEDPYNKYKLMKFLEKKLDRAWIAGIDIQRTPLVTRITLEVLNPGKIIGKRGGIINKLTDMIKDEFGIANPQISVIEVRNPALEPKIIAKKIAQYIEMGKKVRAVLHFQLREIMKNGGIGAEIVASGKIGAKGARSKTLRVTAGYIPKAGEPMNLVNTAHYNAQTKYGTIGVLVRIVMPGTVFPDKDATKAIPLPKVIEAAGQGRGAPGQGGYGGPRRFGPGGPRRGPPRYGGSGGPRAGPSR